MKTGGLIVAAGKTSRMEAFRPLLKLNGTTVIQKEIDTLRRGGVTPIVVVTGYDAKELEKHLAHRGVICIRNEQFAHTEMIDSVKLGIEYLKNQCSRILFLPVDAPLFSADTLELVLKSQSEIAIPVHDGKKGHPVLISSAVFPSILNYHGEGGLRAALSHSGYDEEQIEVSDPGIVLEVNDDASYRQVLDYEQESIHSRKLDYHIRLVVGKNDDSFGPGVAEFLERIDRGGSMLSACKEMNMSYSKGWKMVKDAEECMGFPFLDKKAGGSGGGNSHLTPRGRDFLQRYRNMQRDIERTADAFFHLYFDNIESKAADPAKKG